MVNNSFSSKLYRVNVQAGKTSLCVVPPTLSVPRAVASKGQSEPERAETRMRVDEDRKHEMEAALVRIMKARRQLTHAALVAEAVTQLRPRFAATPAQLKKRIEYLIERDYLQRDPHDENSYLYVA